VGNERIGVNIRATGQDLPGVNILRITLKIHGPRGITLSPEANHSEDPRPGRITPSLKRLGSRITLKIRGPGRSGVASRRLQPGVVQPGAARAGHRNLELGATATRGACGAGADTRSAHTFRASSRSADPRSVQHAERAVAGANTPSARGTQPRGIKPHHKPRLSHAASLVAKYARARQ
jgi:hypothetical protein